MYHKKYKNTISFLHTVHEFKDNKVFKSNRKNQAIQLVDGFTVLVPAFSRDNLKCNIVMYMYVHIMLGYP